MLRLRTEEGKNLLEDSALRKCVKLSVSEIVGESERKKGKFE